MNKLVKTLGALIVLSVPVVASLPSTVVARGTVQEAVPSCMDATAVLLVGDGSDGDKRWAMIQSVIEQARVWTVTNEMKPGIGGTVTFTQYNITNPQKSGPTTAYTVRCGEGQTCNEVAKTFLDRYPEMTPAPFVLCGEENNILNSPSNH